jgi:hypothetical protein
MHVLKSELRGEVLQNALIHGTEFWTAANTYEQLTNGDIDYFEALKTKAKKAAAAAGGDVDVDDGDSVMLPAALQQVNSERFCDVHSW